MTPYDVTALYQASVAVCNADALLTRDVIVAALAKAKTTLTHLQKGTK